jgi:hypothetical protein
MWREPSNCHARAVDDRIHRRSNSLSDKRGLGIPLQGSVLLFMSTRWHFDAICLQASSLNIPQVQESSDSAIRVV